MIMLGLAVLGRLRCWSRGIHLSWVQLFVQRMLGWLGYLPKSFFILFSGHSFIQNILDFQKALIIWKTSCSLFSLQCPLFSRQLQSIRHRPRACPHTPAQRCPMLLLLQLLVLFIFANHIEHLIHQLCSLILAQVIQLSLILLGFLLDSCVLNDDIGSTVTLALLALS